MASEIVWIRDDVVLGIHDELLAEHGGAEGIRDEGLLESALARPRNIAAYSPEADVAELASYYALGVIRNRPFLDGNKRVGLALLELFLELNGHELFSDDAQTYEAIYAAAAGDLKEDSFIAWLRANCRKRSRAQPGGH